MATTCLTWGTSDFVWSTNSYTWGDVCLVEKATDDGHTSKEWKNRLDKEEQKRFIKLVCKVKGIETYSGQKTIDEDITVTTGDVKLVIKEVLGVDLMVENINV